MGQGLSRRFIAFNRLQMPDKLIAIKHFCVKLEKKYTNNNKRIINIDPGYLNEAKLVLSTTKDYNHRLYLGKGVFAEITLCYQKNSFIDLATTYPDYRTEEYKKYFSRLRCLYRDQIHHHGQNK